jgi:uncharacterized protein YndB with AHSA1/START domain
MSTNVRPIQMWELELTRVFRAPRELVFAAWTAPEHLMSWSGPRGFSGTIDMFDCRPGGAFRTCLQAPDGSEHWARGTYLEVSPPHRLVFTHAWEDEQGAPGPETTVTVTLSEHESGTLMHFHQGTFKAVSSRDGHEHGWTESFDRLQGRLTELLK